MLVTLDLVVMMVFSEFAGPNNAKFFQNRQRSIYRGKTDAGVLRPRDIVDLVCIHMWIVFNDLKQELALGRETTP